MTQKKQTIIFHNKGRTVKIAGEHKVYSGDIINFFDYYFGLIKVSKNKEADFSKPKKHNIKGFKLFPIWLPSFPESIATTKSILRHASLKEGDVVLDLGAYCGLSSILMKQKVQEKGIVIAVEPDPKNFKYLQKNIANYFKKTKRKIHIINKAIWRTNKKVAFVSEGNMGSSMVSLARGIRDRKSIEAKKIMVKSITLMELAKTLDLKKIDFIKCDIEGSEDFIFENKEFLRKYKPIIIAEYHNFHKTKLRIGKMELDLRCNGYKTKRIADEGSAFPLILALPIGNKPSFLEKLLAILYFYKKNRSHFFSHYHRT
jgi:FkbM family methyltransferase